MFGDRRKVSEEKDSRKKLKAGIDLLADTVASTMGPRGRNVIIQRKYNSSRITKDGVTVANEFFLEDPIEDIGAQLIKQAAQKTADEAGDGTTTSTVLARAIFNRGLEYLEGNPNANVYELNAGIDFAVGNIVAQIKASARSIDLDSKELIDVAKISANNDIELGEIVAGAVSVVGKEGKVTMEISKNSSTYYEVIKGTVIDQGFYDPIFVTSADSEEIILNNPLIVVSNFKMSAMEDVLQMANIAYESGRSILIIAEEIDKEALAFVAENVSRGKLNLAVVRPPSVSNMRKFMLSDIAVITGGEFRDTTKGHSPRKMLPKYYGAADKVIVNRKQTVIIGGKGSPGAQEERKKAIQENIANAERGIDDRHRERLSKMFSGVATIYIGANSELEQKEKKYRVEDAIRAVQSSLEEGILIGGGNFLYGIECTQIPEKASRDFKAGINTVLRACNSPLETILINGGLEENLFKGNFKYINVKTGKYVDDLIVEGVVDPAKVTRTALENAASVAKTLLTTSFVIYYAQDHLPESIHVDPGNIQ